VDNSEELEVHGRNQVWPNFRYNPSMSLEGQRIISVTAET